MFVHVAIAKALPERLTAAGKSAFCVNVSSLTMWFCIPETKNIFQQLFASLRSITYILSAISKAERVRRTLQRWQSGWAATLQRHELWRALSDVCLQGFLINNLLNEGVASPHAVVVWPVLLSLRSCCVGTQYTSPKPTMAAHLCLQACCTHQQGQATGRLSFRRLTDKCGVIHFEVLSLSAHAVRKQIWDRAAVLQPSLLLHCLHWEVVRDANKPQGQKPSVSHVGAPRTLLQCLLSCAATAHRWCTFEPELWVCIGTEGMLCRWKRDVYHFVFVSSKENCLLLCRQKMSSKEFPFSVHTFRISFTLFTFTLSHFPLLLFLTLKLCQL